MNRALLLNSNYMPLQFVNDRRGIKLLLKEKAEVISIWDEEIKFISGENFNYPAVLRLKNKVPQIYTKSGFSRSALIKRDGSNCQFCKKHLIGFEITIDHIVPRSKGGKSTFDNCVVACKPCNSRKGSKSLSEAKMTLISTPVDPKYFQFVKNLHHKDETLLWHDDWNNYLT